MNITSLTFAAHNKFSLGWSCENKDEHILCQDSERKMRNKMPNAKTKTKLSIQFLSFAIFSYTLLSDVKFFFVFLKFHISSQLGDNLFACLLYNYLICLCCFGLFFFRCAKRKEKDKHKPTNNQQNTTIYLFSFCFKATWKIKFKQKRNNQSDRQHHVCMHAQSCNYDFFSVFKLMFFALL